MAIKMVRYFRRTQSFHITELLLFSMACLAPVGAYQKICPDSDNPFNIKFTAPKETLVDGTVVDIDPLGIEFLSREDVVCDDNLYEISAEDIILCTNPTGYIVECEVKPDCLENREKFLQKLQAHVLRVLDQVVIKSKAIYFFNKFLGAKHLIFGKQPLGKLTGVQIVTRATTGPFNLVNGFSVSNKQSAPTLKEFDDIFGPALELYVNLMKMKSSGPAELRCINKHLSTSGLMYPPESEKKACVEKLFNEIKGTLKNSDKDLIDLIEKSVDLTVNYLSGGTRQFSGLKIPLTGCISNRNLDPDSVYAKVLGTVEALSAVLQAKQVDNINWHEE